MAEVLENGVNIAVPMLATSLVDDVNEEVQEVCASGNRSMQVNAGMIMCTIGHPRKEPVHMPACTDAHHWVNADI